MTFAKRRKLAAIVGGIAAFSAALALMFSSANRAAIAAASPAASMFVADKGSFRIVVNGEQVGKEQFEITPSGGDWIAHGSSEIQSPDGTMRVSGILALRGDGNPQRYQWSTEGKKKASANIDFSGLSATIDLSLEGARPYSQQFTFATAPIVVLDNNLYHQYAILARLYDRQKKGSQTFSVLVPQELTPGSITVESLGTQELDGKKVEELTAKTETLEIDLYLDNGRLVRLVSPGGNAEIIRD